MVIYSDASANLILAEVFLSQGMAGGPMANGMHNALQKQILP